MVVTSQFLTHEVQGLGRAAGNAGRSASGIHPIHAIVAFHYFAGLFVENRNLPRAGVDAGLASVTGVSIDQDQSVFAFVYRLGRAASSTFGFLAVQARLVLEPGSGVAVSVGSWSLGH